MGIFLYEQYGCKLWFIDVGLVVVVLVCWVMEEFEYLDMILVDFCGFKVGILCLLVVIMVKYFVLYLLGFFCIFYFGVDVVFYVGNRGQVIECLEQGLDDFYVFSYVFVGLLLEVSVFLDNLLVVIVVENYFLVWCQLLILVDIVCELFLMCEFGFGIWYVIEQYLG